MITRTISHYNILEVLGEGGMGIVYKARDLNLDRLVALKFLPRFFTDNEELTARFIREARLASLLDHSNICTIHDFEKTEDNQYFIVMSYCPGLSLERLLAEKGPLTLEKFLPIASQIGRGLEKAHAAEIIHRDLKPANIIVDDHNRVKILDFGLAGMREELKRSGSVSAAGTPAYMSPEQLIGNGIDRRSDLWSYAVIMYQMLSGRLPFDGTVEQKQIFAILKEPPDPLTPAGESLPAAVEELIFKNLQKEPEKRCQQAAEIAKELETVHAVQFPVAGKPPAKKHLVRRLIFPALFGLIAASVFLLFYPFPGMDNQKIRIAVMPFENRNHDPDFDYLSASLAEELSQKLSKIAAFHIYSSEIWRTDSTLLTASAAEITSSLGTDYILRGSYLTMNGDCRVNVRLIDGSDQSLTWTDSYVKETSAVYELTNTVTEQIAGKLKIPFGPAEKNRISRQLTDNQTAFNYYLKGRENYLTESETGNERAIILYKMAIDLDPHFALPYVGLSHSYYSRLMANGYPPAWFDSARVMVKKALVLDPTCADAWVMQGNLYRQDIYMGPDSLDYARQCFQKALTIEQDNLAALIQMGRFLRDTGSQQEALPYFKQALEYNPQGAATNWQVGWCSFLLGDSLSARQYIAKADSLEPAKDWDMRSIYIYQEDYDKAIACFKKQLAIQKKHEWLTHDLAVIYKNMGNYRESINLFKNILAERPHQEWHAIGLANAYMEKGEPGQARAVYQAFLRNQDTCSECEPSLMVYFNQAVLLARMGRIEEARRIIREALMNKKVKRRAFDRSMWQIIDFFRGAIDADSIETIMTRASHRLQRQDYLISHYFYLAQAYLYNIKPGYVLTPTNINRAIDHLKHYERKAPKHDVEFSMARVELKKLERMN